MTSRTFKQTTGSADGLPPSGLERGTTSAGTNVTSSAPRLLVGLHTDERAAFLGSKLNPTVRVPSDRVAGDEEELVRVLENDLSSGHPA